MLARKLSNYMIMVMVIMAITHIWIASSVLVCFMNNDAISSFSRPMLAEYP